MIPRPSLFSTKPVTPVTPVTDPGFPSPGAKFPVTGFGRQGQKPVTNPVTPARADPVLLRVLLRVLVTNRGNP